MIDAYTGKRIPWSRWCLDHPMDFRVLDDCKDCDFQISRIYPLKQREVKKIWEFLKTKPFVTEVWIFGSASNLACTIYSDTDIAIRTSGEETEQESGSLTPVLWNLCTNGCDILWLNEIKRGTEIYGNIRRGVRII